MRLRIGVAHIRAGAMRNNGLVKALLELTPEALDAPLGFFG